MVVNFPNGTCAVSIASGTYQPAPDIAPIPATVFKDTDIQRTLIGLSDICRDGQEIRLTETSLEISKNGTLLLHSEKLPTDRIWTIPKAPK